MDEQTARALDVLMRVWLANGIQLGMMGAMYLTVGLVLIFVAKYLPGRRTK